MLIIHNADFDTAFAGTDSGLYYTVNDGQTWYEYTSLLPRAIIVDIVYDEPRRRLILGTQGRGVWSVNLDTDWDFYADCDQNGDVNTFDMACYESTFLQDDPYAVDIDVSSGKGIGDSADLLGYINYFTNAQP